MAPEFSDHTVACPTVRTPATSEQRYAPYAVDWRFLPEELLLAKDWLRDRLARGSNAMASAPATARLWAATLGRGPARAVASAGVLFVHVPKTGGTSISKVLYRKNLPHYTARFWSETFADVVATIPSFAVVRHPVERLLSAYRMALLGGTDLIAYSRYWRSRLRGLESVETFVDFIADTWEHPHGLPLDLWRQSSFILDAHGAVMVDRLFSLDARSGLPRELGRWLSSGPIPHLNATPNLAARVTPVVEAKIREIYSADFAIYDAVAAAGGSVDLRGVPFGQ